MRTPEDRTIPLLLFADDGAAPADVAWAWIASHHWEGWALEAVTARMTLFPGGRAIGEATHVSRQPPVETEFTAWDHVDVEGDPRTVIHSRSDASLIVVGRHPRGHLTGLLAGSTTQWLMGRPPVPLVIARHGHRTRSVAICVDGGPHSQRALEAFRSLPWSADVEVSLLSVDDGATDIEESLASAASSFPAGNPPAMIHLAGSPKREIAAFAESRQIDLVVMGTRGLTGLTHLAVGSTVSALFKRETANLMVAHVAEAPD
ncbi:MAG: universal stress protein [Actinomycetes bacterium]|jgi:nucleotide-binding universal stress UspA family protein